MKQIDRSPLLIRLLETVSGLLAKQRGLPIVVGIFLIVLGAVLEFLNVAFESKAVEMVEIILRNFGLVSALVGILLLEPLGRQ
jgi:hypothetical protein